MEFWLVQDIKAIFLPPASLILLAVMGLLLSYWRRRIGMTVLGVALFSLYALSTPVLSTRLAATQEIYPALNVDKLQLLPVQAIVVLGGGSRYPAEEYTSDISLRAASLERLLYTAYLARQTGFPILTSGGSVPGSARPSESEVMATILREEFKTPARWLETASHNTAENAQYSYDLLSKEGIRRVIIVTHAMHMYRAVEQFERVGFEVVPAPTVFLSIDRPLGFSRFFPSIKALKISASALHEKIGRWWYRLRY
jgi:uncharacterized SAM-binding protein YcdF (DUF218 family)